MEKTAKLLYDDWLLTGAFFISSRAEVLSPLVTKQKYAYDNFPMNMKCLKNWNWSAEQQSFTEAD